MTPNHAIILLAGVGSRLKPLTNDAHKALIPFQGKSILERQITQLRQNRVMNFHLVLGYRAEDIRNFVAEKFPDLNVTFHDNELYEKTNTAYSLNLVLTTLAETFLLLDGDVLLHDDLVRELCQDTAESLLLCETDPEKLDAEAVKVRCSGEGLIITDIGKHIPLNEAHGESIGVGLYQKDWTVALKAYLERSLRHEKNWNWYYEDAMQRLIVHDAAPSPLKTIATGDKPWVEVDDFQDLERAKAIRW